MMKELFFCNDEVENHFYKKLAENLDKLFSQNPPVDPTNFHLNVENLIKADPILRLQCLVFE